MSFVQNAEMYSTKKATKILVAFCTQKETRTPTSCDIRTSSVLVYHSNTWANILSENIQNKHESYKTQK